ncbi:MAG TPA: MarR family transcriptional regulator [Thermoleophilaceae bacterium]|nr:MarR family transcriptional regulator [Thermoleophilaceae bacterium]
MSTKQTTGLDGVDLAAWRGFLLSHAAITRELDADLVARHGLTSRDYEVLLFLAQEPERRLAMSELAKRTMLTRSGVTRLVDGLCRIELVERVSCPSDARVSYAQLTDAGYQRLREAGRTHIDGIRAAFLRHFSEDEVAQLAELLSRLPGAAGEGSCSVE